MKDKKLLDTAPSGATSGDTVIPAQVWFVKLRDWVCDSVCAEMAAELHI